MLSRVLRALPSLALCCAIYGCNLDSNFGDLGEKLLDPDVQGFNIPGQRLLEGAHFDLRIDLDETGTRFALARNLDSELAIADFQNNTHCRTGTIASYGTAISARGQQALIPVLLAGDDGATRLAFTSFACEQSPFQVRGTAVPRDAYVDGLAEGSGNGLLVKTPEGGLVLVDPWAETTRELAESVRDTDPLRAFNHFLWVDRGVITISDARLTPVAYFGRNVTELTLSPEDAELAFVEAGSAPGGPGGTLFVVGATSGDAPREVARDACGVRYMTLEGRRQLAYRAPCAERRLVLHDRADESLRVIASDVAGGPTLANLGGDPVLSYVTTPSPSESRGTLWLLPGEGEPIAIAENVRANQGPLNERGSLLALVDWSSTGGRLMNWNGADLSPVAEGVIELGPMGRLANQDLTMLANYDGTAGDLLALSADLSTSVLASGVPRDGSAGDAFLARFDGRTGELRLLDRGDGSSIVLGEGIARGSFRFAVQFNGIMMLSDRDDVTNTTTLNVLLLDTMRQYPIHDKVTEAREVAFPSPGILYNVVEGADAGVWFAKTL